MEFDGRTGWLLIEYALLPNTPILAMRHSVVFDQPVERLLLGRGTDPDPDFVKHSTFNTLNSRGVGSIPANQIAVSRGPVTGAPQALFAPGTGYTVNAGVCNEWHAFLDVLNGRDDGDGDYSIDVAWDVGSVDAGEVVTVCAYYVFGTDDKAIIEAVS